MRGQHSTASTVRLLLRDQQHHHYQPVNKRISTGKMKVPSFGKYAFYDAVLKVHPQNMVRSDAYYIHRQKIMFGGGSPSKIDTQDAANLQKPNVGNVEKDSKTGSMVFDTSSKASTPSFDQVFGGSTKTATKSSRRDVSYRSRQKIIAGVKVPARPIEPDNCCMSGCINCVWELFNEDLEEWKEKRHTAALKLNEQKDQGGIGPDGKVVKWPTDWELPPKALDKRFIAHRIGERTLEEKNQQAEEIRGMPVGLQVFAMFEKKKKIQRAQKAAVKENSARTATAPIEQVSAPSQQQPRQSRQ